MPPSHMLRAVAAEADDDPRKSFAGRREDSIFSEARPSAQVHRYHVDAGPSRRPKTLPELADGLELIELADRRHPGRMCARRWSA
jgi:hypothetical protein